MENEKSPPQGGQGGGTHPGQSTEQGLPSSQTSFVSSATKAVTESRPSTKPGQESENDRESEAEFEQRMDAEELHRLARSHTTRSEHARGHASEYLFPFKEGSPLDPNSPRFNGRKWARSYCKSRIEASQGAGIRTSGIAFRNLDVYGYGTATDFQTTVVNVVFKARTLFQKLTGKKEQRIDILQGLDGVAQSGEMLCVLGPPGSGCSTLLRTVAGDTYGFHVSDQSTLNYQGIRPEEMQSAYKGEAIYTAEVDHHFPHMTVGDTLYFAARSRCPRILPEGVTPKEYAEHLRDVIMAMFGISHTKNTRVGDDYVRGVSGGERKRVTIAEAALGYSPLQCWDNSTRGLDSANAIEFCRTLRTQADIMGCTSCVAIYQAPQSAYDLFDKVVLLYEGRQIFFGRAGDAKAYFEGLGFVCPAQQTTADFLTSMTSAAERVVRPGWESRAPRTSDEFAQAWKTSQQRAALLEKIEEYLAQHPFDDEDHRQFFLSRRNDQSPYQRKKSPYNLNFSNQITLTLWRAWVMLKADPSISLTMLFCNLFQALIISSIFYNLPTTSSSFFPRTMLIFFIVLMNAFASILEIMALYTKRKIVEKHSRYAFYHPSAEALSSIVMDLPYKIVNAIFLNTTLYFMTNLRRDAGNFFFFVLFSFTLTLTMSMMFRLVGSVTKSIAQALAPAAIILLALVLYAGFAVPPQDMQDWLDWLRWIDPVFYGLESVYLNEFVGRCFLCDELVPSGPGYEDVESSQRVCSTPGSIPGESYVDGADYLDISFGFVNSHRWRNLGVMIAYMALFLILHLFATEYIASERSKGEVLVFTRQGIKKIRRSHSADVESGKVANGVAAAQEKGGDSDTNSAAAVEKQTSIFHWKNVCYDVQIKDETRRILDHVDGWVKPGTLTALMGVSGAGKTTLLDVLATRVTMGVISGEMLVDGHQRDSSFQRKTGYVQQQDLHLHSSTVREALNFSALLRQPARYSYKEKLEYVDTVISLLGMEEYSEAIIGVPGEGLNVEQRKRLTIGVELVARPQLLLFLDEPTSGLDSQTSWSICDLLEKLTASGQAILCTIHQPSAMLFQRFDRLLLLAKGGRTVYFGEVGANSATLMDYFVRNGGPPLPQGTNPAEHMLAVIGAAPGASSDIDWPTVWKSSPEYQITQDELANLSSGATAAAADSRASDDPSNYNEFAAPLSKQVFEVTQRVFQQYWRSPNYLYSKFLLSAGAALFIGLTVMDADNTVRGLQNQMFGVFVFLAIAAQLVDQMFPVFCNQRTLYEARERSSKSYSWISFMFANIVVEMSWNSLMSVFSFIFWYFPIGLYRNAEWTDQVHQRGITIFLQVWVFFLFSSSISHMVIAALPNPDIGGAVFNLLFIMMFAFNGILGGPDELPGFWIFMYRVNPFTYVVESFLGTTLANAPVECAVEEIVSFNSPSGLTCEEYTAGFIERAGGYLVNDAPPGRGDEYDCHYCSLSNTNDFLASINMSWDNRWRNFGFMWAYIAFNVAAAFLLYWLGIMSANLRKTIEGTTREFVMSWDAASELNDASAVNRSVTADCTRRIGPASLLSALGAPADHEQDNAYAEQNCAEDIRIAAIKTTAFENLVIDVEGRRSASRTVAEMNCFDGSGTIVLEFVWFLDFTEDGTKVKRVFEVTDPTAALQIFAKRMESGPTVGGAPQ